MAASLSVEPYMYDVYLLGFDRTLATGKVDEEAIRKNHNFARDLAKYLETKCKLKVFLDCTDVNPGQRVFDALFDVLEKSKFIVPVICPAFMQDCWSKYIADSALLDRLGSDRFIPVCALGVTVQDINDKMKKYRVIRCLYFKADAVQPEHDTEALYKLGRALTAGGSQPVQDDRNNEGPGDVGNGKISQPQAGSAPRCEVIYLRDDVTGHQKQYDRVECQQEGMETQPSESGFVDAPDDHVFSSPHAALNSPGSSMPKTQSKVFEGLNKDCEAIGEETAEERQGQDAVEDASGENAVRSWMGSLSSFLREVAPVIWTSLLYTENSTPQLFPDKSDD